MQSLFALARHGTTFMVQIYLSSANFWCLKMSTPPAPSNEECPVVAIASLSISFCPLIHTCFQRGDTTVNNLQKGLKTKL